MTATQTTIAEVFEYSGSRTALEESLAKGVVPGVKVLGGRSKNGRDYPEAVMVDAVGKYEGLPVNIDHPQKPTDPRSYRDRFGVLKVSRHVANDGIRADLHFNTKHPSAEQFTWDVLNNPSGMGLSHNAVLRFGKTINGRVQVESIVAAKSADIVADPATTTSIFESEGEPDMKLTDMTLEQIYAERPELKPATITLESLTKDHPAIVKAIRESVDADAECAALKTEVEELRAAKKATELKATVEGELKAAKLDITCEKSCSPIFIKQVMACESKDERAELIADRVALVSEQHTSGKPHGKPTYEHTTGQKLTPESFRNRAYA